MYIFEAKGYFQTLVNFSATLHIFLAKNIELIFPEPFDPNLTKNFIIKGKVVSETRLEEYLEHVLKKTIQWLSLIYDVPAHTLHLTDVSVKDENTQKGQNISTRSARIQGISSIAVCDDMNDLFTRQLVKHIDSDIFVLELYNKALNEKSHFAKFWYFYNILLILKGGEGNDRNGVEDFIQGKYPDLPRFRNNAIEGKRKCLSIITTLRDSFSHKTQIEGGFERDRELEKYLPKVQSIVRDLLKEEMHLPSEV